LGDPALADFGFVDEAVIVEDVLLAHQLGGKRATTA
jgi:hypothetical protein